LEKHYSFTKNGKFVPITALISLNFMTTLYWHHNAWSNYPCGVWTVDTIYTQHRGHCVTSRYVLFRQQL